MLCSNIHRLLRIRLARKRRLKHKKKKRFRSAKLLVLEMAGEQRMQVVLYTIG